MSVNTLKDVSKIAGSRVCFIPEDGNPHDVCPLLTPIVVSEERNSITFYIQNGPIKEVGENGCQVDALVEAALIMVSEFNKEFRCKQNEEAIEHLNNALESLDERKRERKARGVEGTSQA